MTASQSTPINPPCILCGGATSFEEPYISVCVDCGHEFVYAPNLAAYNDARRDGRRGDIMARMAAAGVPELFRTVEADFAAKNKVMQSGRGFYFQGGNGTFKSLKAASVARAFLEHGMTVRFVSSAMLASEFRDAMGGGGTESAIYSELGGVDLLVIDDLGKENPTQWAVSMLFTVIDLRYGAAKPVVVTSNYSKRELVERLLVNGDSSTAEAIVSRLFEMTEKVDFGDEDRRMA